MCTEKKIQQQRRLDAVHRIPVIVLLMWIFFLLEFSRCFRESLFYVHRAKAAAKKKKLLFGSIQTSLFLFIIEG